MLIFKVQSPDFQVTEGKAKKSPLEVVNLCLGQKRGVQSGYTGSSEIPDSVLIITASGPICLARKSAVVGDLSLHTSTTTFSPWSPEICLN